MKEIKDVDVIIGTKDRIMKDIKKHKDIGKSKINMEEINLINSNNQKKKNNLF